MKKPAVFLDRDGVINEDKGYVSNINDFIWIKGSKEAIKLLNTRGYYVFVVTNQSGVARGLYSEQDVENLHTYINTTLKEINAKIDDFFYSPYHPIDKTKQFEHLKHLRKPNTGMLIAACKKWEVDKKRSFLIGDSKKDLMCANNFEINGYLFNGNNLLDFVEKIIN